MVFDVKDPHANDVTLITDDDVITTDESGHAQIRALVKPRTTDVTFQVRARLAHMSGREVTFTATSKNIQIHPLSSRSPRPIFPMARQRISECV